MTEPGERCFSVTFEHPRARRYPFVATIELTDTQSEAKIQERTSDLSLYGCRVDTDKPFSPGAKVRLRIAHRSANFVALGRVSYNSSDGGMGIAFTQIEPNEQLILERWIEELRDH
jgi:PilZ domain